MSVALHFSAVAVEIEGLARYNSEECDAHFFALEAHLVSSPCDRRLLVRACMQSESDCTPET